MNHQYYSDTELLSSIATGDAAAVRIIYSRYHPMFIKWICGRGGREEDAEDAFQDGVLVLYEKAQDPEFCLTCSIGTYLFAVCKRIWLKKIEQATPSVDLEQDNGEAGIQLEAEERDVQVFFKEEARFERLDRALQELGEPCAGLIKAFYLEQKNMKDIADEFHYTNAQNAKTQKYKCLNRLRKLFYAMTMEYKTND